MEEDDWSRFVDSGGLFSQTDELKKKKSYLKIMNYADEAKNKSLFSSVMGPVTTIVDEFNDETQGELQASILVVFSARTQGIWDGPSMLGPSPLRMTEETLGALLESMRLPAQYYRVVQEANTVFMEVGDAAERCCQDMKSFIIQNRHNRKWHFSAVLSHCPRRRATRALVHGLTGPEARHLAGELSTAARCQRGWLALPMLLPLLLVRTRLQTAMFGVRDCHRAVFGVECRTGLRTRWDSSCEPPSLLPLRQGSNTTTNNPLPPPDTVDFNAVTADITSVASKLAYAEYLCEIWGPKIAVFDDINRRVLGTALEEGGQGSRGDGDGNDDDGHGLVRSLDAFRDETVLLQSTVESVQLRARYMSKRAQAQVQTIFNLIAQKDSAHLKAIAEEQRRIALAASRDSTSMQVISVITAVFLPATFTATFFSTAFFDFHAGGEESGSGTSPVVSHWLWVYFVVTALLSALVLVVYLGSRRRLGTGPPPDIGKGTYRGRINPSDLETLQSSR